MKSKAVWARHQVATKFCAVDQITRDGRVVTYCRGSWPSTDAVDISDDANTPARDRCGYCHECVTGERLEHRSFDIFDKWLDETVVSSGAELGGGA